MPWMSLRSNCERVRAKLWHEGAWPKVTERNKKTDRQKKRLKKSHAPKMTDRTDWLVSTTPGHVVRAARHDEAGTPAVTFQTKVCFNTFMLLIALCLKRTVGNEAEGTAKAERRRAELLDVGAVCKLMFWPGKGRITGRWWSVQAHVPTRETTLKSVPLPRCSRRQCYLPQLTWTFRSTNMEV